MIIKMFVYFVDSACCAAIFERSFGDSLLMKISDCVLLVVMDVKVCVNVFLLIIVYVGESFDFFV